MKKVKNTIVVMAMAIAMVLSTIPAASAAVAVPCAMSQGYSSSSITCHGITKVVWTTANGRIISSFWDGQGHKVYIYTATFNNIYGWAHNSYFTCSMTAWDGRCYES